MALDPRTSHVELPEVIHQFEDPEVVSNDQSGPILYAQHPTHPTHPSSKPYHGQERAPPPIGSYYFHPNGDQYLPRRKSPVLLCGLAPWIVCLFIAVVAFIIGGLVGGGTGAAVVNNSCNEKLSASSGAATTTETGTAASATTPMSVGCPGTNQTLYQAKSDSVTTQFQILCNQVVQGHDLLSVNTRTIEECMEGCASYNSYNASAKSTLACLGVSFVPSWINMDYSYSNSSHKGSCFLKRSLEGLGPSSKWTFEYATGKVITT